MNHSDFVEKYSSKQIAVDVDKNQAGFMYGQPGLMPQQFRTKQAMIRTLGFGGLALSIALFFFVPWWAALGVLFIALGMFVQAQKSAVKGVLEASLQDPIVYQVAVEKQVLVTRELHLNKGLTEAKQMKTILLVDDHSCVRDPLQAFLQMSGYHILTADNANEAFEHLNESHIDLVITNINMPGMDGIELTRHVTERYNVKVIVTTGMHDCHDEAIAAGAIEFVKKPVNMESFKKLIANII